MINILFFSVVIAMVLAYYIAPKKKNIPSDGNKPLPGPKGIPYFGNIFQIGLHQYQTFTKWAQEYGSMFMIKLGVKRWIVINDANVAHDLMVKRGSNYSARDHSYILCEIIHPGSRGMLAPSGDYWRKVRRLGHNGLALKPVESYTPLIERESLELVRTLFNKTGDPVINFRYFSLNVIVNVVYNKRFESPEDPVFLKLQRVGVESIRTLGFDAVINLLPFLRYLPTGLNQRARVIMAEYFELMKYFFDEFKEREAQCKTVPCVAGYLKAHMEEEGLDDFDIHNLIIDLFGAGMDTTAITTSWMVALLATHPEIQSRAHAEIDAIVGRSRLPTLSDRPNLPFTHSILRETFRFRPATGWLSIPHQSVDDDVYAGYHIPGDTTIVVNVWALHMDPQRYDHPEKFDPDRFMGVEDSSASLANGVLPKRDHFTFGWGRRLCAGVHLAENEGFISLAQLLWCYRIETVQGEPAPIIDEWQLGITMAPKPFKVKFVPRDEGVRDVIFK